MSVPSISDFIRENPFEKYRDDLEQERRSNKYLGHTMFWKDNDLIPAKYIYNTENIEYRNLKLMFMEMCFFFVMLTVITGYVVASLSRVEFDMLEQQLGFWGVCKPSARAGGLTQCSLKENSVEGFWDYIENTLTPKIFKDADEYPSLFKTDFLYDLDENSKEWRPRYLGDTKATVLLGTVRMRQLRTLPNKGCLIPGNLSAVRDRCHGPFVEETQSVKYYVQFFTPKYLRPAYRWEPRDKTEMQPITGAFGTYPGDGFMLDFPLKRETCDSTLTDLREWKWIDIQTRSVVVEITAFNPNVNVVAVNRLLFEFGPSGLVRPSHEILIIPTQYLTMAMGGSSTLFGLQVLVMVMNLCFLLYHIFLGYKNFFAYITYTWNIVDIVNLALFSSYVYYRIELLARFAEDNSLQPELAGMPDVYMPYAQLREPYLRAQAVLSWYVLFSWVRVFKYLSFIRTLRVLIRTLERCAWEMFVFSFLYISIKIGFALAFVVGFGDAYTQGQDLYMSLGGSFYALFFMLNGGVDLTLVIGQRPVLGSFLFVAYLFLIVLLLFNFFMAMVVDVYTFISIQMADFSPEAKDKKNCLMVFLYTYICKLRGQQLVKEDDEAIGMPDEQYIELSQLPGYVAETWLKKQIQLRSMVSTAEKEVNEGQKRQSKIGAFVSGMRQSKRTNSKMPGVNEELISRLQLQRLLDEEPKMAEALRAKRGIDVIRRFRTERGPDPATEYFNMQENVILALDQLEKVGLTLEFSDVEVLKMVANGLNDALTEVQNQWRSELTVLLESASKISIDLIELTNKLQQVMDKHNEIAREIVDDAEEGPP